MRVPQDWTFKSVEVASGFDHHVREQLPWYELMAGATAHFVRHYLPYNGTIVDIGCSTGNLGVLLQPTLTARAATYIGIDNATEMQSAYRGPGQLRVSDITMDDIPPCDVAVLFLVLMFIPMNQRNDVLKKVRQSVRTGGMMLIVDKMPAVGGYLGTAISRLTLAGKAASGVSGEEIMQKELSLCGVQRPVCQRLFDGWTQIFQFGEFYGVALETP
jgi:tRNA (cmo5U34)-methyltransferase